MMDVVPCTLALFEIGSGELMLIVLIALLMYGGELPKVARSVGKVVADLRRSAENLTREFRDADLPPRLPPRRSVDASAPRELPKPPAAISDDDYEPPPILTAEPAEPAAPPAPVEPAETLLPPPAASGDAPPSGSDSEASTEDPPREPDRP